METGNLESIYGANGDQLDALRLEVMESIDGLRRRICEKSDFDPVEHCLSRIKSEDSMREKCRRSGLPETTRSALVDIHDSIGLRVVCAFRSDVYLVRDYLAGMPGFEVVEEKDYIRKAKPIGYRSYHMILDVTAPYEDARGRDPGHFFIEIQLRTIAMDSWAALEHEMKYKHEVKNAELISRELKRCADELASCDLSMQTIRNLIRKT